MDEYEFVCNQCYNEHTISVAMFCVCVKTYLWVLNDEDEYDRALYYGAAGIMTDFPSRLSQYLNGHHRHNERWMILRS